MIGKATATYTISASLTAMDAIRHHSGNYSFEPRALKVTFGRDLTGEWYLAELLVTGPRILADGSVSASTRGVKSFLDGWPDSYLVEGTPDEVREFVSRKHLALESLKARG